MINDRKLSTADILASNILNISPPDTKHPEINYIDYDELEYDSDKIHECLKINGVEGCMYYGVWKVWPDEKGFSGELLQYRSITDEFTGVSIDVAVEKCIEWAGVCEG